MTSIYDHSEAHEIAANMTPSKRLTFSEALDIVKLQMPDESYTVQANVAEALALQSMNQRLRFIAQARNLSDNEIRRHAWVATANGPFDPNDDSFTTVCELVRQEKHLPPLHDE